MQEPMLAIILSDKMPWEREVGYFQSAEDARKDVGLDVPSCIFANITRAFTLSHGGHCLSDETPPQQNIDGQKKLYDGSRSTRVKDATCTRIKAKS